MATPAVESGWLIERRSEFPAQYLTVLDEMFDWTTDSTIAVRFSRREDADRMSEIFLNENVVITEHQWGS